MQNESDHRPSPDLLLEQAREAERGKLKIFLGAAPGVGKTYSMLRTAHLRSLEGVDVVIGIIETHKRSDTEEMTKGFEVIPRSPLTYRGKAFEEMDIDAILERKPALVLIDELAHTNIIGARHTKRYMDVEEILAAGINVYTTLNIQHVESLHDVVERITGVAVRETVPDNIIGRADEIELIDLAPDELLQRLREGKVYVPEQAKNAINRFFTLGNLTALRELSLRKAAERVDAQMTSYMRRNAITGPWPTSDRIMACLDDDGNAISLVRAAKRSADRRGAPWIALYIETRRHARMAPELKETIHQALHLAESLGAETMTVVQEDVAQEILSIASERNVSTLLVSRTQRLWLSRFLRTPLAMTLLDLGDGFDISVINTSGHRQKPQPHNFIARLFFTPQQWRAYAKTSFLIIILSTLAWFFKPFVSIEMLAFIYLVGVAATAVDFGFRTSLYSGLLSLLSLHLLFTYPRDSFMVTSHQHNQTLLVFALASIAMGAVGYGIQQEKVMAQRNADRMLTLYSFSKAIVAAATLPDMLQTIAIHVYQNLKHPVAVLLPGDHGLEMMAHYPLDTKLDTASQAAGEWAFKNSMPAGFKSNTLPAAPFLTLPFLTGGVAVGVLAIQPSGKGLSPDQEHLLANLVNQAAVAIERAKLMDNNKS